jgi:biotin carboxyl carrier protein
MPGNIIKLKFSKGDKISEGDCLLIIEAMKMELSIYANIDGEISEMNVIEGETVDTERVLAVIETKK